LKIRDRKGIGPLLIHGGSVNGVLLQQGALWITGKFTTAFFITKTAAAQTARPIPIGTGKIGV